MAVLRQNATPWTWDSRSLRLLTGGGSYKIAVARAGTSLYAGVEARKGTFDLTEKTDGKEIGSVLAAKTRKSSGHRAQCDGAGSAPQTLLGLK